MIDSFPGATPQTQRLSLRVFSRRLRKRQTGAEVLLWEHVRGKGLGVRFHRQAVIGRYIADFFCPAAKLVVEVDGGSHSTKAAKQRDAARDRFMVSLGLTVLRVTNRQVRQEMPAILDVLRLHIAATSRYTHGAE